MHTPERDSPLADLETTRIAAVRRPPPRPWLVLAGASAVGLLVLAIVLVLVNTVAANLSTPATSVAVHPTASATATAPSGSAPTPAYPDPTQQPVIPPGVQATYTPFPTFTPYPTYTPFPRTALPYPWQSQDVGISQNAGTAAYDYKAGTFTILGSGGDIWGNSDQFQFMTELANGDMRVVAHVTALSPTNPWTKAGVMMRYSLDPGSPYAYMFVTPQNGVDFQFRTDNGAGSNWVGHIPQAAPYWVMLTRQGNTFTGYASQDGQNWQGIYQVGISMPQGILVGFALTSHDTGQFATAQMNYMNASPLGSKQPSTNG